MKNLVSLHRRSLWGTAMGLFLASLSLVLSVMPAQGQTVIATVPVGGTPARLAVNPATNKIYVPNYRSNNVTVIDGATNSTITVTDPNASAPFALAINQVTNKIYVPNSGSNNVTVIDGATNSATTITDPNARVPVDVAVNQVTNKIYVVNGGSVNVTVIDGDTNSTATVTDPNAAGGAEISAPTVAVNPATNKIYVLNAGNITVIDGATNSTTTVPLPNVGSPDALAVNPVTNKIYVANLGSDNVAVIDGATNSTTTVPFPGGTPAVAVAVNPVTNKIYVVNADGDVLVIDGGTNSTTKVFAVWGANAAAVNTVTNKIYVPGGNYGDVVAVIDGATNSTSTVTDRNEVGLAEAAVNVVTDRVYVADFFGNNVLVIDGGPPAPPITLFPSSLIFGSQFLNTTSKPQTVSLTTGAATLNISRIATSGNFSQTNNCGSSVLPGASCTIVVTYRPTRTSTCAETGTVTITDDASGSPQTVKLSGFGSVVTLSVKSLNFGNQAVGTTSSAKTITFTNHSTSRVVSIAGISIAGPNSPAFAQANTCGTSLAAGASCTISVTFTPHGKGSRIATLYLWNNGSGTVQTVALSGNGT